jgi:uncharacterized membrane protein (DUF485 family)
MGYRDPAAAVRTERVSDDGASDADWSEIYASGPFAELMRRRRRFVVPALGATMATFLAFILLSAYARDFMGASLYQGLTVGMVLVVVQYAAIYLVTFAYLRRARSEFAPLAALVADEVRSRNASADDVAIASVKADRS